MLTCCPENQVRFPRKQQANCPRRKAGSPAPWRARFTLPQWKFVDQFQPVPKKKR